MKSLFQSFIEFWAYPWAMRARRIDALQARDDACLDAQIAEAERDNEALDAELFAMGVL